MLISEDDKVVLMDFGSTAKARYMIMNRQEALQLQEFCDSHCTPSFRAPELYDIGSDALIDERSDVWVRSTSLSYN
jgi:serine/threonine kinase 16